MNNSQLPDKAQQALALCLEIHKDQIDRDGKPHFEHCIRVAKAVPKGLEDIAYLHDSLEDTDITKAYLQVNFDEYTARLVGMLTRNGRSWNEYIDFISTDKGAAQVKLYDIMDNLMRGGVKNEEKKRRYLEAITVLIQAIYHNQ